MKLLLENLPPSLVEQRETLARCLEAMDRVMPLKSVYLFGSHARGEARPDSDVDLCLVAEGATEQLKAAQQFRQAISEIRPKPAFSLLPIAANDDASKNNFQTLLIKYLKNTVFQAGTATTNSDFASSIYPCPVRLRENHWRTYVKYNGTGNPWKISYGMNQYTLLSFPPAVTSPRTAKLTSVLNPANTFLISDISYELNHPAVIRLTRFTDGTYDVGYKHGSKHPTGRANIIFMDAHVSSLSARQTNGIIMDFKQTGTGY